MAKVTVEIEVGNDAMQTSEDVATALQKVSFILEENELRDNMRIDIFDENGNNVGALRFLED